MNFPLATLEQALPDGAFCLPMQKGACVSKPFDAVYSARCPVSMLDPTGRKLGPRCRTELSSRVRTALGPVESSRDDERV